MRPVLLAATLAFAASLSNAEAVRVRSGEHADFSRLVLDFEQPTGWSQSQTEGSFEIRFDRTGVELDLDRVFDKIPKDRIRNVNFDRDRGVLVLSVGCDCVIDMFPARKHSVAIDVRARREGDPEPRPLPKTPEVVAFPFGRPGEETEQSDLSIRGVSPGTMPRGGPLAAIRRDRAMPGLQERLDEFERQLVNQLGRAASQGIAEISADQEAVPARVATTTVASPRPSQHIRARTIYDDPELAAPESDIAEAGHPRCFDEGRLDVASWLDGSPASTAIARARRNLVAEFNDSNPKSVQEMAQTYIALGFGAEAGAVLAELGTDVADSELLMAMAGIVDGGRVVEGSVLDQTTGCDGPAALWAFAGHRPESIPKEVNAEAVQTWFLRLPDSLRRQLGPAILENFLAMERPDAAATIREALKRMSQPQAPEMKLVEAKILAEEGEIDVAIGAFRETAKDAVIASPAAMREMLRHLRKQGTLSRDDTLTAEALAFEHRGTDIGDGLLAEVARSWSHLGEFGPVWRLWDELAASSDGGHLPEPLMSALVQDLLDHGQDGEILEFVYSSRYREGRGRLSREINLALATWLIGIGDAEAAGKAVHSYRAEYSLEIRKIRARIALLENEPALALSFLAAEVDPGSLTIKAEALSMLGNHLEAAEAFEMASMPEAAEHEAWLHRSHDREPEQVRDPQGPVAGIEETDVPGKATPAAAIASSPDRLVRGVQADGVGSEGAYGTGASDAASTRDVRGVTLAEGNATLASSRKAREAIHKMIDEPLTNGGSQPEAEQGS